MNPFGQRDALRPWLKLDLLKGVQITKDDLNKIFVGTADKSAGRLVSREELRALPISEIGEWYAIGMPDVTVW